MVLNIILGENDQREVVQQLNKVLHLFLLRRLKSNVEKGLPRKKEIILKVGMSQLQNNFIKHCFKKTWMLSILEEGFSNWTHRDFNTFVCACEKYG